MRGIIKVGFCAIIIAFYSGCSSKLENADLVSVFDFEAASQDWIGGISDYPVASLDTYNYVESGAQLMYNSVLRSNGLSIGAENPHGELFYFFQRKIDGLKPNAFYKIDFEFLIMSQLNSGVAKNASEDIFLKIGAVNYEPELTKIQWKNDEEYMILNVEKGLENKDSGNELTNVGSIMRFTSDDPETISGNTFDVPIFVRTDQSGSIWLIIGVDSGIKNYLTFSMVALTVYYTEK